MQVTPGLAAVSSSSIAKAANVPLQRTIASPALKTRPAVVNDVPEAPSHDFLKWISDSLKGLNSSVNGMCSPFQWFMPLIQCTCSRRDYFDVVIFPS
jgi:hypothetical protein